MLWIVTGFSLIGVVLNIYKNVACFWIWLATNITWAIVDFSSGLPEQGALMSIYAALAIWGIVQWSRNKSVERMISKEANAIVRAMREMRKNDERRKRDVRSGSKH